MCIIILKGLNFEKINSSKEKCVRFKIQEIFFTVFWDGGIGKGTKEQCGLFKKLGD